GLITCNRCGKENQDHYKFCLGCGNELTKAPPAPAPGPAVAPLGATVAAAPAAAPFRAPVESPALEKTPPPMAIARTEFPPMPAATPAPLAPTSGEIKASPMPAASSPAARPKGGIPWNDSPKMPAQMTPPPAF